MAERIPYDELSLIRPEKFHDRSSFACNDKDLTEFFCDDALKYKDRYAAVTYVCIYKESIVGFVTIAMCSVTVKHDERKEIDPKLEDLKEFPGLRIARLATHKEYERHGIGEYLIKKIAKMGLELVAKIGVRLIIIDSKPDVVSWYEKFGFSRLEHYTGRHNPVMYIDLLKAGYV